MVLINFAASNIVGNILMKLPSKSYMYTYLGCFFTSFTLIVSILRLCTSLLLSAAFKFFIVSGLLLFSFTDTKRRFSTRLSVRTVFIWSTQYFEGSCSFAVFRKRTIQISVSVQRQLHGLAFKCVVCNRNMIFIWLQDGSCYRPHITQIAYLIQTFIPYYGFPSFPVHKLKKAPSVQMWYEHILLTRSNKS